MATLSSFTKKRIFADIRELKNDESPNYTAAPLDDNLFEWHFTIRGPVNTEFEGGVYHGRILLPSEYPFKPPNIIFLTPNGRFKQYEKICLSISAHHPEHWQPAWGVRLILEALISFLPTEGNGAVGALDYSKEERAKLAKQSQEWCCSQCGKVASLLCEPTEGAEEKPSKYAEQIAQLHFHNPTETPTKTTTEEVEDDGSEDPRAAAEDEEEQGLTPSSIEEGLKTKVSTPSTPDTHSQTPPVQQTHPHPPSQARTTPGTPSHQVVVAQDPDILLYMAYAIGVAIVAILLRKLLRLAFG